MRALGLALVALLATSGCALAWSESYSVSDPSYKGKAYSRVLVFAETSDLRYKAIIERAYAGELAQRDVKALTAIDLLPPTRQYSPLEMASAMKAHNIESILFIAATDSGETHSYVPESQSVQTKGRASFYGRSLNYNETTTVSTSGGYTISKPWMAFKSTLVDAASGQTAWLANSKVNGNGFASYSTLMVEQAKDVVSRLQSDGKLGVEVNLSGVRPANPRIGDEIREYQEVYGQRHLVRLYWNGEEWEVTRILD